MHTQRGVGDDRGMSMVEVVISMLLLALLSVAILPLFIGITQTSVFNRDLLEAGNFAQRQITTIQAAFPSDPAAMTTSCATLKSYQNSAGVESPDSNFTAQIAVAACPESYPGTTAVTVTVFEDDTKLVELKTLVRVAVA